MYREFFSEIYGTRTQFPFVGLAPDAPLTQYYLNFLQIIVEEDCKDSSVVDKEEAFSFFQL